MVAATPLILSKSAFAARRGVGVSAVCKWIERGRISGEALTGDGQVNVEIAERQLGARLDPSRSVGKILARAEPDAAAAPPPVGSMADIKLAHARIDLEKALQQELERRGVYVRSDEVRREFARQLSELIATVEQRLPDLVRRLGGGKAEVTIARQWWRGLRQSESERAKERVAKEEEFVVDDVERVEALEHAA